MIEDLIEHIARETDQDLDYQTLFDNLLLALEHPLNINTSSREDLEKLQLLRRRIDGRDETEGRDQPAAQTEQGAHPRRGIAEDRARESRQLLEVGDPASHPEGVGVVHRFQEPRFEHPSGYFDPAYPRPVASHFLRPPGLGHASAPPISRPCALASATPERETGTLEEGDMYHV